MNRFPTPEPSDLQRFRRRLLDVPGVRDVHVCARTSPAGAQMLAYVVGGEAHALDSAAASETLAAAVVRVSCLPLDRAGLVDEAALAERPVWTASAVAAAEAQFAPLSSALIQRPLERERTRLHLADLVPGQPLLVPSVAMPSVAVSSVAVPSVASHAAGADGAPPAAEAARARSLASSAHPAPPALHLAPPLVHPEGMSTDLAAGLRQLAARPGAGFTHIASDLSETRISYAQLLDDARRVLDGMRRRGIQRGDRVIVDASDARTLLPLFWACVLGGMVPAPFVLNPPSLGSAQLKRLRDSWEVLQRPPVIAGSQALRALQPHLRAELDGIEAIDAAALRSGSPAATGTAEDEDDEDAAAIADPQRIVVILLTSGSTGTPKGVMLSQRNVLSMIAGVQQRIGLAPGDTALNWMPLDHVGGIIFLSVMPVMLGMNQVHVDTATILAAPVRWLDLVHAHRVGVVWVPNFAFDLILQAASGMPPQRWDLSCMRMLVNAGEAVSDSILQAFNQRFAQFGLPAGSIWPSFGMTETVSAFSLRRWAPTAGNFASMGLPVCGAGQRVVDEGGQVLPEGSIGRIELSGPSLFAGYFGRPDLTAEVMREGWFQCGDLGFLRAGELYVIGRSKEMIIVNGANFYSAEIEEVVAQVEGIERLSIAAIGVRAPGSRTDQLALFFHAADAGSDASLRRHMQAIRMRLGKEISLMPEFFIAVPQERLPRTPSGKIQRIELKRMTEAGHFDAEIKHAACLLGAAQTVPAWFDEPLRVRREIDLPEAPPAQRILVLGATRQALAALQQAAPQSDWIAVEHGAACEQLAPRHWRLDAGDAAQLAALFQACADQRAMPDAILVLGEQASVAGLLPVAQALTAAGEGQARMQAPMQLHMQQPLQSSLQSPLQLPTQLLVCSDADAANNIHQRATQAMLGAFLRSVAVEIPGLRCRHLLLPAPQTRADLICRELHSAQPEPEVEYRDGLRHVTRLRKALRTGAAATEGLPRGGVVLIAGAMGGIGLLLARHLQERHAARLLLLGRRPRPALDSVAAQALAQLEAEGEVLYACADVADPAALQAACALAQARWQSGLDAVFHLAGEGRQMPLGQETQASLEQALRAKLAGTRALYALVADRPDAWFVLVGSVAGLLGGHEVAAYAAANAYQAAFVGQLAAAGRQRCRYLGFSSWREIGMSRGSTSQTLLESAGYQGIEPQAGLASLDAALHGAAPVLCIGLDLDHARHAWQQDGAGFALDAAVLLQTGAEEGVVTLTDGLGRPQPVPRLRINAMPLDADGAIERQQLARIGAGLQQQAAPRNEFERYMAQLWRGILNLADCGVEDDFFALGGNSLLAAQVAARTREVFRLEVAMSDLLGNPTVAAFCARLRAAESKPGLCEAIARRLFEIARMTPQEKEAAREAARRSGKSK